jgi:hypothetical protein
MDTMCSQMKGRAFELQAQFQYLNRTTEHRLSEQTLHNSLQAATIIQIILHKSQNTL